MLLLVSDMIVRGDDGIDGKPPGFFVDYFLLNFLHAWSKHHLYVSILGSRFHKKPFVPTDKEDSKGNLRVQWCLYGDMPLRRRDQRDSKKVPKRFEMKAGFMSRRLCW
jgi:hypothetical protein